MNSQILDEKPKKSRSRPQKKSKEPQSKMQQKQQNKANAKARQVSKESEDISSTLSEQHISKDAANHIKAMISLSRQQPSRALREMLCVYEHHPAIFHQRIDHSKVQREQRSPVLFYFVHVIVEQYQQFPFDKSEKIIKIFQDLLRLVSQSQQLLHADILYLNTINESIWSQYKNKPLDGILQNAIKYFLQVSLILFQQSGFRDKQDAQIIASMIGTNFKRMVISLEKGIDSKLFKAIISAFVKDIFLSLSHIKPSVVCEIPLFDFAALSFSSQHCQFYGQTLKIVFDFLMKHLQSRKEQRSESQQQFKEDYDKTLNILLTICNIFNFSSVFSRQSDQTSEDQVIYSQGNVLLVVVCFKKYFIKVLQQLQKIGKGHVPSQVIRNVFRMASYCNNLGNRFAQNFKAIQSDPKLKHYWNSEVSLDDKQPQKQKMHLNSLKEAIFFELLYKIEKMLESCEIQVYLDQYISNPIFKRESFIENIFNNSPNDILLRFMVLFTHKWLLDQIKNFDFNHYLMKFFNKCIHNDICWLIGSYLKQLQIPHLLRVNSIIFEMSFEEDKKGPKPEISEQKYQLAYLTSGGFADKYSLVNKLFPDFSEQLVWKQLIKSLFATDNFNFICVKTFYNVVFHQFGFSQQNAFKLNKILTEFEVSISKEGPQKISSIFHLLSCICFKDVSNDSEQRELKASFQEKLLELLIQKSKQIVSICDRAFELRRSAMVSLISARAQLPITDVGFEKRLKRFNSFFLESIVRWMQRLQKIGSIIKNRRKYEDILEAERTIGKDQQFRQLYLLRTLSNKCSQNYFANMIERKIKAKVLSKKNMFTPQLMYLTEIMSEFINKYGEQPHSQHHSLSQLDVLDYYQAILSEKIDVTRQRDQLKQKLLVLNNLRQVMLFFNANSDHESAQHIQSVFQSSFKSIIVEIAVHNPAIIGRYQRELIMHLRATSIMMILQLYSGPFEVLGGQDIFGLFFQLCVDKSVEIRMMVFNLMTSRFKSGSKSFLTHKYRIASFLTIFWIFEPTPLLKNIAKKVVETLKKASQENIYFGFLVLIFSLKLVLNDTLKALNTNEDQFIYIDKFCRGFDDIWMTKKEAQYMTFLFATYYLEEKSISFVHNNLIYNRYGIARHAISRQKQDILMEQDIKQRLKSIDFQFPPDQVPDLDQLNIKRTINILPDKIFERLKQLIVDKSRPVRYLKSKKDIVIHWKALEKEGLITLCPARINQ